MKITIVGGGFVGIATSVSLAERGHLVTLVESDAPRLSRLARGELPFHEPGLGEAFAAQVTQRNIRCSGSLATAPASELVFVCVGTPPRPDGSADLTQLEAASDAIAGAIRGWGRPAVVAVKSTVPPGTTRRIVLARLAPLGVVGDAFGLAANPEFLREGSALADARDPDRIVVGSLDGLAEARMRELYRDMECPYVATTLETAEMTKYAANALLAIKVSFANEMANLCEPVGVHVDDVMKGVGLDARLGPAFLTAGLGFGGSCFPKDVSALAALAREKNVPARLLDAVLETNDAQPLRAIDLAREIVGPLRGKRILILGLAFKAATSDVRGSRALVLYRALAKEGAEVTCTDPVAGDEFARAAGEDVHIVRDVREALVGQDLAILHTAWPEYASLAPDEFLARMRRPAIVDGRRALDAARLHAAGIEYRAIGVGTLGGKP